LNRPHNKSTDSIERLVEAGVALLGATGRGGVTVRAVAAQAGLSVAAVQHHFPTKERLLDAVYAEALARDAAASLAMTRVLGMAPGTLGAARRVLSGLLAINCGAAAPRTAARNEALLGCARQQGSHRHVRRWRARRLAGLTELVTGLTAKPRRAARLLLELLVGLEVLSLGCREQPLTPQLNEEVLDHILNAAFGERRHCQPDWLGPIVEEAVSEERAQRARAPAGRDRGTRARVLDAAARVLCEQGATALNHRSVARQADLVVSAVGYYFPTKANLLFGTFQHIRGEITRFSLDTNPEPQQPFPRALVDLRFGEAPAYLGMLEAVISAATDTGLRDFAWRTRLLRGVYHLRVEQPENFPFSPAAFDRFAFANWSTGATLLAQAGWPKHCVASLLHMRLARMNEYLPA